MPLKMKELAPLHFFWYGEDPGPIPRACHRTNCALFHLFMKFFKKILFMFFKSIVLILLIFTYKPVLAYRPSMGEKSAVNMEATKDMPLGRARVPPSAPDAWTYIPRNGDGGHCAGNYHWTFLCASYGPYLSYACDITQTYINYVGIYCGFVC